MAYYDFLNVIFAPLLKLPPVYTIIIISFVISLLIILITKYTTNQALMKQLKEESKEYQKQIKESRNNPSKAMEIQKKAMESNIKYMSHSLRPTLITFIPIILIFGWMNSNFAYEGIKPLQEFSVTAFFDKAAIGTVEISAPDGITILGDKRQKIQDGKSTWKLKGNEGEYLLEFSSNGEEQQHSVLISNARKYLPPNKKTNGMIKNIQINYNKLVVVPIGYRNWFGWLGVYIILSIIFTMVLRKLLKVY